TDADLSATGEQPLLSFCFIRWGNSDGSEIQTAGCRRFYARRAIGGDRDHRRAGGNALAGRAVGPRSCPPDAMHEQSAQSGDRDAQLSRHDEDIPEFALL